MTMRLADHLTNCLRELSSKSRDGSISNNELVLLSGISDSSISRWLKRRGWQPVHKGSAAKVRIESWTPPPNFSRHE